MAEGVPGQPGLPAEATERWLGGALPDLFDGGPWRAEVISGGLSNVTYRLWLPGGTVILRRPPLGRVLPRAHDMAREYRVLQALSGTPVPVPEPLAICTDPDVLGVTFYVMRDVPGSVLRRPEDTAALSPATRGALASSLIEVLADLHDVSPDAVGLGDYGRHSGYCVRQIRTWGAQWERSRTRDLPDMETLLARLAERAPEDSACTIVHGDFRLDNTVVTVPSGAASPGSPGGSPRVAAVLDWELSTLGDPLADLATTMSYWHDPGDVERGEIPVSAGLTDKPGFPSAESLAAAYAARTGRDLRNLSFYLGLAWMKLAVICEGVHARYLGGQTVGEGYEKVGPAVPLLAERGLRVLGADGALPVAAADDLVDGAAVRLGDGTQRTVRRVAQGDLEGDVVVVGHAEDLARRLLVADRGVTAADAEVRGGDHDGVRGLAQVVVADELAVLVVVLRDDQRDGGRCPGDVAGAPPHGRHRPQLLPVGDDDEFPVLPVARGGRSPARFGDAVEVGVRNRVGPVAADVAAGADGVPGLHGSFPFCWLRPPCWLLQLSQASQRFPGRCDAESPFCGLTTAEVRGSAPRRRGEQRVQPRNQHGRAPGRAV
jgi:aminoglycoside phosphotransferase (APT) family kinase protein